MSNPNSNEAVKNALLAVVQDQACKPESLKLVADALKLWGDGESEAAALKAECNQLRRLVYMPATWKCDTCGFEWNRIILNPSTGQCGAPLVEEVPICPNKDGQPMRRVTWEECAGSNYEACQRFLNERDEARKLANQLAVDLAKAKKNRDDWRDNASKLDAQLRIIGELPTGKRADENLSTAVHRYVKDLQAQIAALEAKLKKDWEEFRRERDAIHAELRSLREELNQSANEHGMICEAHQRAKQILQEQLHALQANQVELEQMRGKCRKAQEVVEGLRRELGMERAQCETYRAASEQYANELTALRNERKREIRLTFDKIEGSPRGGVYKVVFASGQELTFDKSSSVAGNVETWLATRRHAELEG